MTLGIYRPSSVIIYALLLGSLSIQARSIHRSQNNRLPIVTINWQDKPEKRFQLKSRYLEPYPFFELFNHNYFYENLLPTGPISFRYEPEKSVDNKTLSMLIEDLIEEIKHHKHPYSHFTILRDRNFNYKHLSGLIIARCNDYPFVVKLFIENPETFIRPFRKGFVPACFFFMAGGINRHSLGFTRIQNLKDFKQIINKQERWAQKVAVPRKWFWLPREPQWLTITGKNFKQAKELTSSIPATYCIVADAINIERTMSFLNKHDRKESLRLCNDVKFCIDPHIDNFMIEKGTGKIVLVDTEHFPSMVGLKEVKCVYHSQVAWYIDLSLKCANDMFFRPKP